MLRRRWPRITRRCDACRRREVEQQLREGRLRAVVTSTSLELGVDIGTADLSVLVGLPGGVARCVQRVGRSGHRLGAASRGLILASNAAEIAGAVVTARAAREGKLEPLRMIESPLDVVCQQIVALACAGECAVDDAFAMIRRAGPMAGLSRADFDACLDFLAGNLAAPPGAYEPEPGAGPRWSAPRIWKHNGWFGIRSTRVARWFWTNVGTITSEESAHVLVDGVAIGTVEGAYAERLSPGDRFVLDGRSLEFRRREGQVVHARSGGSEPGLPVWHSDRQALLSELAFEVAEFRFGAAQRLTQEGPRGLRSWLIEAFGLRSQRGDSACRADRGARAAEPRAAGKRASGRGLSRSRSGGLVLCVPCPAQPCGVRGARPRDGCPAGPLPWTRPGPSGCRPGVVDQAAGRGRDRGRRAGALLSLDRLEEDVLEGLDKGELPAHRFRHIAATGLMVLRNPEPGRRLRVGGLNWVSSRLFPLVKAACPDHPLLRETRREVLQDLLDVPSAVRWLATQPAIIVRGLATLSPFAAAWITPSADEPLQFESPDQALRRLHAVDVSGSRRGCMTTHCAPSLNGFLQVGDWLLAPAGGIIRPGRAHGRDRRPASRLRVGADRPATAFRSTR